MGGQHRSDRWVDIGSAASAIQRTSGEAETALGLLAGVRRTSGAALVHTQDLPRGVQVWTPGPGMVDVLPGPSQHDRERIITAYAKANGSVTSTIAMAITGVTRPTANQDLARLETDEVVLSRGAGPNAHYGLR